ncbi:MAG: DNA gyrase inhibitor YacG [Hyphomonadaceae bacterium]|nr:DNA gyrase inhibitor YacG [Hyphomonadaceae bacterium]MBC6412420.1 DNA gyrase inhibitor YacG [Hyphomonadaceae bacterium]
MTRSTCPICSKDTAGDSAPFCSRRCSDIDLARWLNGSYAIPGEDGEADIPDPVPTTNSPE